MNDDHDNIRPALGLRTAPCENPVCEDAFQQIANNIDEVFWMCQPGSRRLLYVSPSYERVWGRSLPELYENPCAWLDGVHPEDLDRLKDKFLEKRCRGDFDEEYRIICPDDTVRWVRDRAFTIQDEQGCVCRVAGIAEDITKYKLAEQELEQSRTQLRELVLRQNWDREMLRTRIAREIHDELGQSLMALNLNMYWLMHHLPEGNTQLEDKAQEMIDMIVGIVKSVQQISSELRPSMLDDLGLAPTMSWYLKQFQDRSGVECDVSIRIDDEQVDSDHATAVYRILQEAITNIARHSSATAITVRAETLDGYLTMEISDNGCGFDQNNINMRESFGLIGMRERASALGGNLEIVGKHGEGTRLYLTMPLTSFQASGEISSMPADRQITGA